MQLLLVILDSVTTSKQHRIQLGDWGMILSVSPQAPEHIMQLESVKSVVSPHVSSTMNIMVPFGICDFCGSAASLFPQIVLPRSHACRASGLLAPPPAPFLVHATP